MSAGPEHDLEHCTIHARWGLLVTACLLVITSLLELTAAGHRGEIWAYQMLIRAIPAFSDKKIPIVVDISRVPGGTSEDYPTPRKTLAEIIDAIALKGPKAIAVDIDFSPKEDGWMDPADPDFFEHCLAIRHQQHFPIVLGVFRASLHGPDWLALPKYQELAAGGLVTNGDSRVPRWIASQDPHYHLPTFAEAIANYYRTLGSLPAPSAVLSWFVEPEALDASGGTLPDEQLLMNYSKLESQMSAGYPVEQGNDIAKWESDFAGRIVFIGRSRHATDLFNIPGFPDPIPGVQIMAAAAYTVMTEPLFELRPFIKLLLDVAISLAIVSALHATCKAFAKERTSNNPTLGESVIAAAIIVGAILVVFLLGGLLSRYLHILWLDFLLVLLAIFLHPSVTNACIKLKKLMSRNPPAAAAMLILTWTLCAAPRISQAGGPTHNPDVCRPDVSAYVAAKSGHCKVQGKPAQFDQPLPAGDVIQCPPHSALDVTFCRTGGHHQVTYDANGPHPGQYVVPDVYPRAPDPEGHTRPAMGLADLIQDPRNWATPSGDYANHRYSELDQINTGNVHKIQVAWTLSTGVLRGHEGAPLVVNGIMYVHTPFPNNVYAIDLKDQTYKWAYQPKQDPGVVPVMCCDTVNRGLGYGDGKIFLQQADTTLVALDALTGKVIWTVKNGDPRKGETNTNAPHVFKDKVITGISGGEFGVRGRLVAYDIRTGKQVWRAYSTGPDADLLVDPKKTLTWKDGKLTPIGKDSSLKSWKGDQWKIGGGTTWGWYSYDPKLNLVYYGTGNPGTWNPSQRPGDNRWTMSIFARDLDTGVAKWVYQMTPHDEWDYDGVNEMVLIDIPRNGQSVPALVHFDRNGFAYTLNRENGELLVAEKYDPTVTWATRVDMKTGRPVVDKRYSPGTSGPDVDVKSICPAALGSKDEQPSSYDVKTGLLLVPTNHVCMTYEPFMVEYTAGQPYVGATLTMYPTPKSHGGMGNFIAWDPTAGKIVWSKPERFSVWSGALSTAGGIVFYGTLEGYIKAVSVKDGKELWKFKTPSGIIGNVFTYEYAGRQYVGVYSGIGGWAGIGMAAGLTESTAGLGAVGAYKDLAKYVTLGGALFVFSLPDST